jgi:cysteinyl-tRNA synthetase, unknown class
MMLSGIRAQVQLVALTGLLAMMAAPAVAQMQPAAPVIATPPVPAAPAATTTAPTIRSWGYQLQGPNPDVLANVPYDAIVIDYSRDGRDETALTAAEVARLKVKPDGTPRAVLAYMSIGEAESYRFYWKRRWSDFWFIPNFVTAPAWRGKLNGDWGGNYAVRYWEPEWQAIITGDGGYLDRIIKAGFDGVWLDKVDSSLEDVALDRPTAKADMIAFVKSIGDRGRRQKPGFRVFPQNGEALLSDPGYRASIDGFGKEGLLYGEDGPHKPNAPTLVAERVALLRQLVAEGKPVLAVEYLDKPAEIDAARLKIAGYGFVPHFGDRLLGAMRLGDYATTP